MLFTAKYISDTLQNTALWESVWSRVSKGALGTTPAPTALSIRRASYLPSPQK